MNTQPLLRALLLAATSLMLAGTTGMAQGEMEWLGGTVYDFGTIQEDGGTASHTFILRNKGQEPFCITAATGRCRCTTATFSTRELQPGDTAHVTVRYNPWNQPGTFSQRVAVRTTAEDRTNYLFVKGTVAESRKRIARDYPHRAGGLRVALDTLWIPQRKGTFTLSVPCINDTLVPLHPTWVREGMPLHRPTQRHAMAGAAACDGPRSAVRQPPQDTTLPPGARHSILVTVDERLLKSLRRGQQTTLRIGTEESPGLTWQVVLALKSERTR